MKREREEKEVGERKKENGMECFSSVQQFKFDYETAARSKIRIIEFCGLGGIYGLRVSIVGYG